VVIPAALQNTENPNAQYRHSVVTASPNPLPFARRWVVSDGEAINDTLRKMRATFKQQMGLFNGWRYDLEFQTHSQDGAFFVSDTMMTVDDSVNKVSGSYYVQSVQRSQTLSGSTAARLVLRKPGLLNPGLQALGGGARKAHG
jgi:hypothetical protein